MVNPQNSIDLHYKKMSYSDVISDGKGEFSDKILKSVTKLATKLYCHILARRCGLSDGFMKIRHNLATEWQWLVRDGENWWQASMRRNQYSISISHRTSDGYSVVDGDG